MNFPAIVSPTGRPAGSTLPGLLAWLLAVCLSRAEAAGFAGALADFRQGRMTEAALFASLRTELALPESAAAQRYGALVAQLAPRRESARDTSAQQLGLGPAAQALRPWAGADQEPHWQPDPTEVPLDALRALPLPPGVVGRWIPREFRLAEVLGLGTNALRAETLLLDPALETGSRPRYLVESRLRYVLLGRFHSPGGAPLLETFRRELDTRRRVTHLEIHAGPDVRPERTGDLDRGTELANSGRNGGWHNDQLTNRLARHSSLRVPSEAQTELDREGRAALHVRVAARLQEWLDRHRRAFLQQAAAANIEAPLDAALAGLTTPPATTAPLALLPDWAAQLPRLPELAVPPDEPLLARRLALADLRRQIADLSPERQTEAALRLLAVAAALPGGPP